MKKSKISEDPYSMYSYQKYNEGSQNLNENDINQINDYIYESYQNIPIHH